MKNVSVKERQDVKLSIGLARSDDDVIAAQRLRWAVFAEEQGVDLKSFAAEIDIDELDPFCDHLVVKQVSTGRVVGTCRLMTAENAHRHGGYYSEQEFELGLLLSSGRRLLELGRSCVHRDHRNGGTIALLWSGIAAYQLQAPHDAIIGCASIPLGDRVAENTALAHQLAAKSAPPNLRVAPHRPLPLPTGVRDSDSLPAIPPLIKGYLRCGAVVCGAPYWDESFNTADLFMYLPVDRIEARYARHFLGQAA